MGMLRKVGEAWSDVLKCEWDMHSAEDFDICLDDFNGHVGRHIDGGK